MRTEGLNLAHRRLQGSEGRILSTIALHPDTPSNTVCHRERCYLRKRCAKPYKKSEVRQPFFCAAADESARQRAVRCCKLERMQNLGEKSRRAGVFFPPSDVQSDGRRESVSKPSVRLNHLQLPIISESRQLCSHKAKTVLRT